MLLPFWGTKVFGFLKVDYVFDAASKLRGLSFGIQGSWLNQAGALARSQLRVFANYEVPLKLP